MLMMKSKKEKKPTSSHHHLRICRHSQTSFLDGRWIFLVGFVEERLPWPIQSHNKGRKKKANS